MQKMINFDGVTKENIKENISNWPQFPDHPYRGSGSIWKNKFII